MRIFCETLLLKDVTGYLLTPLVFLGSLNSNARSKNQKGEESTAHIQNLFWIEVTLPCNQFVGNFPFSSYSN